MTSTLLITSTHLHSGLRRAVEDCFLFLEFLRSIKRDKSRFKEASSVDPRHRESRFLITLRVIDHAYQARLALCIGDKELQISSALSAALRDLGSSTATTTTSKSSWTSSDQNDSQKEERDDQKIVDRQVVSAQCNLEVVVPEKEEGEVLEKQNYLAICAPPTV